MGLHPLSIRACAGTAGQALLSDALGAMPARLRNTDCPWAGQGLQPCSITDTQHCLTCPQLCRHCFKMAQPLCPPRNLLARTSPCRIRWWGATAPVSSAAASTLPA